MDEKAWKKSWIQNTQCIGSRMESSKWSPSAEFKYEYFYVINLLSIYSNGTKSLPVFPRLRISLLTILEIRMILCQWSKILPGNFCVDLMSIARELMTRGNDFEIHSSKLRRKANSEVNLMKFINGSFFINFVLLYYKNLRLKDPSKYRSAV